MLTYADVYPQGCDALVVVAGTMQDDVISFPKSLALYVRPPLLLSIN
jgi:hypothetical protein